MVTLWFFSSLASERDPVAVEPQRTENTEDTQAQTCIQPHSQGAEVVEGG